MHFPNLVQCVGIMLLASFGCGGYVIEALVKISLRFGNLLNPMIGLSWSSFSCLFAVQGLCH